jgi:perosamine synthetase
VEKPVSREIRLSGPDISEAEIAAVTAVLRTPNLSLGPKVGEFEQTFRQRLKVKHAIAASSGTAALHLL